MNTKIPVATDWHIGGRDSNSTAEALKRELIMKSSAEEGWSELVA